jgi:hypothetical protein
MQYRVNYEILVESRTDTFLGSGRSDLSNLHMVVEAPNPSAACKIVENMHGGWSSCRTFGAVPIW